MVENKKFAPNVLDGLREVCMNKSKSTFNSHITDSIRSHSQHLFVYGFNVASLYLLEPSLICEIGKIIVAPDPLVYEHPSLIYRSVVDTIILPFFRTNTGMSGDESSDEVLKAALVKVADNQSIRVDSQKIDDVDANVIAQSLREKVLAELEDKLNSLDADHREALKASIKNQFTETARTTGLPIATTAALAAAEASGFGVYMATSTGLSALATALGTTFSWGVYQTASTVLGVILGPVGWTITALVLLGSVGKACTDWAVAEDEKKLRHTKNKLQPIIIPLLFALGDSPFDYFQSSPFATHASVRRKYRDKLKLLKAKTDFPSSASDVNQDKLEIFHCHEQYNRLMKLRAQLCQRSNILA